MVKKNLFISLALFGLLFSTMPRECFADVSGQGITAIAPDPAGLVAHYEFEGDAGDTSAFRPSADGTLVGNPTFGPGVFGQAIDLDGDGDYVDCGNESFFDINDQLTVTSWIKVSEFDKKYQTIIARGDNSWRLARAGDSNNIEFACNGTAATRWTGKGEIPWAVFGTTDVNDGKWHHIAGVFDGTRLQLYIDGVLEAAKSAAKSVNISKYNVCIGANAQVPGREWNGFIDDVRIYNYALSQAEIVSVMGESEIDVPSSLPATLYDIAKRYDGLKKFEEAKGVCQLILQRYPDSSSAAGAQLYLSGRNILSLIKSKNFTEAQAEFDTLIADFNDHPDFPEALYVIAQAYSPPRKFKEAESVYEQLIQLFPDSPYAVEALFRAPKIHIFYLIKSGSYTEAEAAIDKLTADFAKNPALPGVVYWFGKEFEAARRYERAKSIYQQVVWRYPESSHSAKALLAASKMDVLSLIESGDDPNAQAALDSLIADFNDHPDLPDAVFVVGEQYYNEAFRCENQGLDAEARDYFRKAITVFERIITELPPDATYTAYAYHLVADCYQRFGDKYCGSYVVWHTLHHYGLGKPIDVIVEEMQIEKKASISMYEVVQALETSGISAHAVKLKLDKVSTIDRPFIQYIAPTKGQQLGHFRLCIPTGSGKAVILDGAEEPKVIDLAFLEEHYYEETRWDGTSILIDGIEKSTLQGQVSMVINLNVLVEIGEIWLETDASDSDLSLDIQLSLWGGCPDDCKNVGENCWTDPSCESPSDCEDLAGTFCCGDQTQEQKCQKPGSLPNCVYDDAHKCRPKKQLTGYRCTRVFGTAKYCGLSAANYGDCAPTKRITQCHN